MKFSWSAVSEILLRRVEAERALPLGSQRLDAGQRDSLRWIADRIGASGIVLADEVGTGKTRIACALVHAVIEAGGRAAVVVPHGLMHQWVHENRLLDPTSAEPRQLTTITELLRDGPATDAEWDAFRPRADQPEWWLLSHGFGAPRVKSNTYPWRAALPALVEMVLASRTDRGDRRTRIGRLHHETEDVRSIASEWGWNGMARIAHDVAPRVRGVRELRRRIRGLPPLNASTWNNVALFEAFKSGEAMRVTEELLGHWLGSFDLFVIDEAHKSRGEFDEDAYAGGTPHRTVLARLVDDLLKSAEHSRRLCLTATPMELGLDQWSDLLKRARARVDRDRASHVIERFQRAISAAKVAPDEPARLQELCAAAREFERTLAPYVTRRRRDEDPLVTEIRVRAPSRAGLPHPHRRLECLRIDWTRALPPGSPWLSILFAVEALGHAARGLPASVAHDLPRALRDAYTKIAAGHVNVDLDDEDSLRKLEVARHDDEPTAAKLGRVAYWTRRLRHARDAVRNYAASDTPEASNRSFDPDADHPRILAAVREIERFTDQNEKVLVFGVFLKPLRYLRDVLNVRHALRTVDAGRPLSQTVVSDSQQLALARIHLDRLRADGVLRGILATTRDDRLPRLLADRHRDYERLRRRVREGTKRVVSEWRGDPTLLGSAPLDRDLEAALHDHFVTFVLDAFLATRADTDLPTRKVLDELAPEFVALHLRPILAENDDPNAESESALGELRHAALRRAFVDDTDSRQSFHARLLQGSTEWETRRYLQSAFNRRDASPRVLVAQSQVGREGLNLHEACRVVLQFHAEWNPAILEQQIGRVDRKGSRWEQLFRAWLDAGAIGEAPVIEVRQLVFDGTYDAFQWERVHSRQHVFDASLFGSLLPAEALLRLPPERLKELARAAPSFRPLRGELDSIVVGLSDTM